MLSIATNVISWLRSPISDFSPWLHDPYHLCRFVPTSINARHEGAKARILYGCKSAFDPAEQVRPDQLCLPAVVIMTHSRTKLRLSHVMRWRQQQPRFRFAYSMMTRWVVHLTLAEHR